MSEVASADGYHWVFCGTFLLFLAINLVQFLVQVEYKISKVHPIGLPNNLFADFQKALFIPLPHE
jgi:hypothetical protein